MQHFILGLKPDILGESQGQSAILSTHNVFCWNCQSRRKIAISSPASFLTKMPLFRLTTSQNSIYTAKHLAF